MAHKKDFCIRGHKLSETGRATRWGRYCIECRRAYQNDRSQAGLIKRPTKEHAKRYMLRRNYGITLEQVGKICEICGTLFPGKQGFHVDHCHKTGKVRGTLCSPCNLALGMLKDNPEVLISAADYLRINGNPGSY